MSEAPERIWADGNADWDTGSWGLHKEYEGDVEYVRADRIEELEAKLAKAVTELRKLGEAAKENAYGPYHIVCHGCSDTHHAVDAIIAELTGGKDE